MPTPPAEETRLPVLLRSMVTQLATATQPAVPTRWKATPLALTTQPAVLKRSASTPPAHSILRWGLMPGSISRRAITILISALRVSLPEATLSALAGQDFRRPHISLAFTVQ